MLVQKIRIAYWFVTRPKTRGVRAAIFNGEQILLVRHTYYPDTWTLPGGGVQKGETAREAVVRECLEEVGVLLSNPEYKGDIYFEQEYKKDTVSVFRAEAENPTITIDGLEIAEVRWCNLDALPPMGPNARAMLSIVLQYAFVGVAYTP